MTVGDLREYLEQKNEDIEVFIAIDNLVLPFEINDIFDNGEEIIIEP